jgi:hypothetical protein
MDGTAAAKGWFVPPTNQPKEIAMLLAITSLALAAVVTAPATTSSASAADPGDTQAELILGSAVVDRVPQPLPEKIVAGQTIFAFTQVTGPGGGYVEHVWTRDGQEIARHYLPLGQSKRWRTWSRHKVAAGEYHVAIIAQNGALLQEASFEVFPKTEEEVEE